MEAHVSLAPGLAEGLPQIPQLIRINLAIPILSTASPQRQSSSDSPFPSCPFKKRIVPNDRQMKNAVITSVAKKAIMEKSVTSPKTETGHQGSQ